MSRRLPVLLTAVAATVLTIGGVAMSNARTNVPGAPELNPADFVSVIDNPYFPLPVGRTLVWSTPSP